ncbi:hypothetical protein ACFYRG_46970 [Streptomyces mirabilis]|uniref:hypothetical protein n=1 Tax=Streptomyces mirabilis TaxID=68239 RepID=UPI0036A8C118
MKHEVSHVPHSSTAGKTDEAHRTSGRIGKPWAVVHDNTRIPSLRRLYMTATPRLWQLDEDQEQGGAPGELVASMEDDPNGPFGARCYTLTLSEAIDRKIYAPYQVVCVDVTDTQFQAAVLLGAQGRSDQVRGARLAALQTALVKASAEENFKRTLVFHHVVKEEHRADWHRPQHVDHLGKHIGQAAALPGEQDRTVALEDPGNGSPSIRLDLVAGGAAQPVVLRGYFTGRDRPYYLDRRAYRNIGGHGPSPTRPGTGKRMARGWGSSDPPVGGALGGQLGARGRVAGGLDDQAG